MIPKIIHVTWKTKNVLDIQSPILQQGIQNLVRINPDWNINVYDDYDIDSYLREHLDDVDYNLIQSEHVVARCDTWRLVKLYLEGGMYLDLDRLCNKEITPLIPDNIKWVLPICRDYDFSHDMMISEPGNPVYLEALKLRLARRAEGNTNVYFLGSQTYMHAITKTVFGEVINTNPGPEKFKWMKEELSRIPFIKTVVENPPCDTFLYQGDTTDVEHEKMKRALYKDTSTKHWTGEW